MHAAEFRRCLEQLDVAGIRALWRHVSPHLPQPVSDTEALVTIHGARTQTESLSNKARFYSHRWLLDNGFPSSLPDVLRPSAERMYPRIVEGVGISVNFRSPILKPITDPVRVSMEDAVSEAYADGKTEPTFVKVRMQEAREKSIRKLVGALI